MSNSSLKRKRWTLSTPKAPFETAADFFKRGDVWARVGLCALATAILWGIMAGWAPPFAYRAREAPLRDLHARTEFEFDDLQATDQEKQRTQRNLLCFYANDQQALEQLREKLIDDVFAFKAKPFEEVADREALERFFLNPDGTVPETIPPIPKPVAEVDPEQPEADPSDADAATEPAIVAEDESKPQDPMQELSLIHI